MAEVTRYFVGYPKPRIPRMPFVIMGLAAVLAHPATAQMAAAAIRPIVKLQPDRIELHVPLAAPPDPVPEGRGCSGGLRGSWSPQPTMSMTRMEGDGNRESVAFGWMEEEAIWPARSIRKRLKRLGVNGFYAEFRVCVNSRGRILALSCLPDAATGGCTGEGKWLDEWLAGKIRPWWDAHVDDQAIRHRGCYILSYEFD